MTGSHVVARHIVFVQYGDYAEAVNRFAAGGMEDYYAQKYTVDHVTLLASRYGAATVITFGRAYPFEMLPNGVGAQGVVLYPESGGARHAELLRALEQRKPTDLILCSPIRPVLRWAMDRRIRALPLFADSFRAGGVVARFRAWLLARSLNDPHFPWVANHHIAASQELARIGVDPRKILPFDWPPIVSPSGYLNKEPPAGSPFRLLYVGMLAEAKGIGDLLRAMPWLPGCTLTVIGAGADEGALRAIATGSGIASRVEFLGKVAHTQVLEQMRGHDAVVVPSRHEYPEGLPMTIYEALCTRTPVLASDHPMFLSRLSPDRNAIVFKASDPAALATAVQRLSESPELYRSLSRLSGDAAETYLCPLKWHDLIDTWLRGDEEAGRYLSGFSIARRSYA